MEIAVSPLPPGLYLVATPIGAARDITLRALDILASANVLAAEDTRTLRRLMGIHGIPVGGRPLVAYHDRNGATMRPRLLGMIGEGRSVAYASDAGTPLVSDPGFGLVRSARAEGLAVTSSPGPSAVLAALAVSGLPTDRFLFAGFPPTSRGARLTWLSELRSVPATLVVFESPRRIHRLLSEMADAFGERDAAVCRELTKRFEEVMSGSLEDLATRTAARALKGEIVLVVDRGQPDGPVADLDGILVSALAGMSVRDASESVAKALGLPRRRVYREALRLTESGKV
ncbi:MAG: 16S rRNA (cytidine(1402)-2'-O)-methyltransferase [Rhodobacter sp.]|nr:16S rRNA (cytidine(1402)-2'-O)-methyltransferase [Rhodobacter sp.]